MERKGFWDDEQEKALKTDAKKRVMEAFLIAEKKQKPNVIEMFKDVYHEMPRSLQDQYDQLMAHLEQYKQHYPNKNFHGMEV